MKKAYVVRGEEGHAVIVYAENGNKARSAARGMDTPYADLRARRAPEFDGGRPSDEVLCRDHGWVFECFMCYKHVSAGDLEDGAAFVHHDPYCAACMKEG